MQAFLCLLKWSQLWVFAENARTNSCKYTFAWISLSRISEFYRWIRSKKKLFLQTSSTIQSKGDSEAVYSRTSICSYHCKIAARILKSFNENKSNENCSTFVVGAPGTGKSTQCKILSEKFKLAHIVPAEKNAEEVSMVVDWQSLFIGDAIFLLFLSYQSKGCSK